MSPTSAAMLCPVVVGREAELAEVEGLVGGARAGRGRVLVLEGEAGMGKSRLATEAVGRSALLGLRSAVGRASDSALVPFRPLAEALMSAARNGGPPEDGRLDAYRPALGRIVPDWAPGASAVDASLVVVAEAMLRALTALAAPHGLLVVLEDLHWADAETLAVFEYVADNIASVPVAILATLRPRPPQAARLVRSLVSRGAVRHRILTPLGASEVVEIARQCLECAPAELPAGLARLMSERSGGLPLLAEDLLAALVAQGRLRQSAQGWQLDRGDAPVPARFGDIVTARLAELDDDARAVVITASVFGPRFDWHLLAPATGQPPELVAVGLRRAVEAQLVVQEGYGFGFRHSLTCDVVAATLDPPARAQIQAAAARALEASHPPESEALLARLLIGAGETARGLRLLISTALHAVARGALHTAQAHLREAIALGGGDFATLDARIALLRVLVLAGDAEALDLARDLPQELRLTGQEDRLPEVLLLATRAAVTAGVVDEARRYVADARQGSSPRQAAEIAVIEANLGLATVGRDRIVGAEHLGMRAVAAADAAGTPDLVCEALEIVGRCARVRSLPAAEASFARALQVATDHDLPLWRIRALNELGTVDMFRDVDPGRLVRSRQAALDAGALHIAAGIDVNLAAAFTMRGNYDEALRFAEECGVLAERCRLGQLLAVAHLFQGVVATHQARFADMRAHVRRAEALAGDDPDVLVGTWGMCRAMASLLREDHDRAARELDTASRGLVDRPALAVNPVEGPHLLLRTVRGEAAAADVEHYAQAQAIGARWSGMWAELARGVVAGHDGDHGRAARSVAAAVDIGRPMPLFLAIGLRLAGQAAVEEGWGDPGAWLADAARCFRERGHVPAATACRDLLRRSGLVPARDRKIDAEVPDALRAKGVTAREHQVLGLVGQRLNNRQIADRLFLSPRTVEKHVSSLFSKLHAERREDLAVLGDELSAG